MVPSLHAYSHGSKRSPTPNFSRLPANQWPAAVSSTETFPEFLHSTRPRCETSSQIRLPRTHSHAERATHPIGARSRSVNESTRLSHQASKTGKPKHLHKPNPCSAPIYRTARSKEIASRPDRRKGKRITDLLGVSALVGVVLDGGFAVGLLEVVLRGGLGHPEDLVVLGVVALLRRAPEHLAAAVGDEGGAARQSRGALAAAAAPAGGGEVGRRRSKLVAERMGEREGLLGRSA
jgi:hypothetical protein